MTPRKTVPALFAGLTVVLAMTAIAWACTPSAYLFPIAPASGAAGSEVTMRGGQFGNGPIELRWGSANGKLLGTALGPDFSIKVQIPDTSPGVNYLVAISRDPADLTKVSARRAEAFEVTSLAGAHNTSDSFWDTGTEGAPASANTSRAAGIAAVTVGMAFAVASTALILARRRRAHA